jgi:putative MATE family efflux protein
VDDHRLTDAPPAAALDLEPPAPVPPHAPPAGVALPTWRLVVMLAWPVLLQQWLVISVPLFDSYLAGAAHRTAPQAVQTTANYLSWFVASYTVLVSAGSTALVARFVGAGDRRAAVRATNQALVLALLLGLLGGALGVAGLPALLELLQVRGEAAALTAEYMRPLFLLLAFPVVTCGGIACLVGAGDTRTGLYIYGGVALLNIPLTWLFFKGAGPVPALGFVGIAWGTALSHVVGSLVVVALLARGRAGLRLVPALLPPDWPLLYRLLRVSVPAAVDSLSLAAAQLWFLRIVNGLSEPEVAAHGIALRWEAVSYQSGAAFGVAAMALVGQNLGAGRPDRAARAGWTAFLLGGGLMTFFGAVFYVAAPAMFRLFCPDPSQEATVAAGVPVLRLVALAMPPLAATMVFTAALRGAGDTAFPVLFTWFGFLAIRIPLAYWLTSQRVGLGLYGAWLAMSADLLVRGAFFVGRFAGGRWKTVKV